MVYCYRVVSIWPRWWWGAEWIVPVGSLRYLYQSVEVNVLWIVSFSVFQVFRYLLLMVFLVEFPCFDVFMPSHQSISGKNLENYMFLSACAIKFQYLYCPLYWENVAHGIECRLENLRTKMYLHTTVWCYYSDIIDITSRVLFLSFLELEAKCEIQ